MNRNTWKWVIIVALVIVFLPTILYIAHLLYPFAVLILIGVAIYVIVRVIRGR